MTFDMSDYVDVPTRIRDFKAKHPEGCLRPADPARPYTIEQIDGHTFIVVVSAAYRSPDDPMPGIGMAFEPFPGKTPYTRDSELQNAETSSWGRAIVAALASESRQIASSEDVRNRNEAEYLPVPSGPPWPDGWESEQAWLDAWAELQGAKAQIRDKADREQVTAVAKALGITKLKLTPALAEELRAQIDLALVGQSGLLENTEP